MATGILDTSEFDRMLLPTEFSTCRVYIKCGEQSLHFGRRLGYEINRECEIVLGLGMTAHTRAIDSLMMQLTSGNNSTLTLLDEHNISHILDISLISFEVAPRIHDLDLLEILGRSRILKEKGTQSFQLKELETAFYLYGRAMKYLICAQITMKANEQNNESLKRDIESLKCLCHLNLAACQLLGTNMRGAIKNCADALEIEPNNVKAFYRRGQAYTKLKEYELAIDDLKKAAELDPGNRGIAKALTEAKKSFRNENLLMADRLKGIFSWVSAHAKHFFKDATFSSLQVSLP